MKGIFLPGFSVETEAFQNLPEGYTPGTMVVNLIKKGDDIFIQGKCSDKWYKFQDMEVQLDPYDVSDIIDITIDS